jgi:polyhydroxyalkanoate synthesis regulator phasin
MPEKRRDISEAVREAVDRTVAATVDTRERAQGAVDELAETLEEVVKEAGENLKTGRKTVREAVDRGLPATQDDVKALRAELRKLNRRLDALEATASKPAAKAKPKRAAPKPKPKRSQPKKG